MNYTFSELTEILNGLNQRADKLRESVREVRERLTQPNDSVRFNTDLTTYGDKQRELGMVLALIDRTEDVRNRLVD